MHSRSALAIVKKYHPTVTRVTDARYSTKIEVTKKDCRAGKAKAPNSCALANAFCREHDGAIVSLRVAYLIDGDKAKRYMVPSAISREIVSFDRGQYFAPGIYRLDAPSSTERLLIKRKKVVSSAVRPGRGVRRIHKTAGIRTL